MAESFHFNISIISRGKGKSAVASAAYISGEKIKNEWDGELHDHTHKDKILHTDILLPKGIPQLILAGASVDDVYVIVLFSTFVGMMQGKGASIISFINIPVSIFLGIMIGILLGLLLADFFKKIHIRDTSKMLIILSITFLLVVIEDKLTTPKATVQAAIGGIPLALGFSCGDTVLTVAVLAIVFTAPIGAFAIDLSYKKLLQRR